MILGGGHPLFGCVGGLGRVPTCGSRSGGRVAKILVVDDDPDILVLVGHTLEGAGYEVESSSDPEKVAALAIEHRADAVILDIMMPSVSGFDALRALREEPRVGGIPILFLSARSDSKDRVRGLREGADDFLSKPFEPEELVLRVERLVARRPPAPQASALVSAEDLERSVVDGELVGQLYLGRYKALELVGEGAMGLVFRGWDPSLKRPVALKTLRLNRLPGARERRVMVSRLLEEAVTVARFSHPNIVAVYDVAEGDEAAFMAMEYIDGISLADYLEEHAVLEPESAIALGCAIAKGLAAAHEHQVVHHDVKPGNVLLGRNGSVKVTDFGVAQLITVLAREREKVFGTPGYLPPEALLNEGYDKTGDLFGLGVILYQAVTGEPAIRGRNIHQIMLNTVRTPVIPPRELVPTVPAALEDLIMDLLAKDPQLRPESADEVVRRLVEVLGEEPPWSPPIDTPRRKHSTSASQSQILTPIPATAPIDDGADDETRPSPLLD